MEEKKPVEKIVPGDRFVMNHNLRECESNEMLPPKPGNTRVYHLKSHDFYGAPQEEVIIEGTEIPIVGRADG